MQADKERIRALFRRFAEGTCTAEEQQEIADYLSNHPEIDVLPQVEELAGALPLQPMPAAESEKVLNTILAAGNRSSAPAPVKTISFNWMRIAAIFLVVVGAGAWWLFQRSQQVQTRQYANQTNKVQLLHLPDGSVVYLNRKASIDIPEDFGQHHQREIWLHGEAFFEIAKDPSRPFTVHTPKQLNIRVLGTHFNVKANGDQTFVVLNEGSVQLSPAAGSDIRPMLLEPGEMAGFDAAANTLTKQPADTMLFTAWKDNLLAFKNNTLREAAQSIEDIYGQSIHFDTPGIAEEKFTGYLAADSLPQALHTLKETFGFHIEWKDSIIHIKR